MIAELDALIFSLLQNDHKNRMRDNHKLLLTALKPSRSTRTPRPRNREVTARHARAKADVQMS